MGVKSTGSHPTTTQADGHLLEYFRQTFGAGGGGTNAPLGSGGQQQVVVLSVIILILDQVIIEHIFLQHQELFNIN